MAQTITDWELLLLDDGSTDNSRQIALSFQDERIKLHTHNDNRGLSAALNRINAIASGRFVARLDGDDLMHPERLARQLKAFDGRPEADVVYTDAYVIDDAGIVRGARPNPPVGATPAAILRRNGPIHASILQTQEFAKRIQYLDGDRRGEDLDLWTRVVSTSRIYYLPERLYFIRESPQFAMSKYRRTLRAHRAVFRRHASRIGGRKLLLELLTRSYCKEMVYVIAGAAGLQRVIASRRRAVALSAEELSRAQAVVDSISSAEERSRCERQYVRK